MDILIKAYQWIWRNKERMVLAVLVIVLFWQVMQVVQHSEKMPEPPITPRPAPPADIPTPEAPEPPDPEKDYSALHVRNPFWVYSSTEDSGNGADSDKGALNIKLLDIQRAPSGGYTARIRTQDAKWYRENEAFESYKLLRIDAEGHRVQVYSEQLGESIWLEMQQ